FSTGHNVLSGDTFTGGFVVVEGAGNKVLNNVFADASLFINYGDEDLVQGNTFTGKPAYSGIALLISSGHKVIVTQNHFALTGGLAIDLQTPAFDVSAYILNNVISTSGLGTGIFSANGLEPSYGGHIAALIQGNDFRGNLI